MISVIDDITETFNNLELSPQEKTYNRAIDTLISGDAIQPGEILLDETYDKEDGYKYIQRIGDDIVRRNNNDPDLTPEGLPTIEIQLKKIQEIDEQTNKERPTGVDNLIKLRCVVMHIIGLSPLTDTRFMKPQVKNQYIRARDTYIIDLTQDKLDADFGRICHETIFENGEDVSKYPIFL
jgi:hypothetical protein